MKLDARGSRSRSTLVKPEVAFLEDLFQDIAEGRLRVPRFQRPFVWRPQDMLELFDSLQKGYPIGSLLFWETNIELQSLSAVGALEIPVPASPRTAYILDGHQRLSTLYTALRLPPDFPRDADPENWRWWIWYDLESGSFTHVPRGDVAPTLLPVRAILKTVDFLEFARRVQSLVPDRASELIDDAERLAQRIKSYKLAITRIQGGTLGEAVDIFSRLNTRGQSMSPDQMVSALTYAEVGEGFHLAERIDEILEKLAAYHFSGLSRLTVFRSIVAAASMDVHRVDWSALADKLKSQLPRCIDAAEASLLAAARFLAEKLEVAGDRLLPYSQQMLLLSEFFHHCDSPSADQERLLRRWFWATSFSGWFAGANTTQINEALAEIRLFATGRLSEFKTMRLDEPARPFPRSFDLRSARVRTLLLVTTPRLRPRGLDGARIDAWSLLRESGSRALVHVFRRAQGDDLSNPANRIFLVGRPGASARGQITSIAPQMRTKVYRSHGISAIAASALESGDAATFVRERAQQLAAVEYDFMIKEGLTPPREGAGDVVVDSDDSEYESAT